MTSSSLFFFSNREYSFILLKLKLVSKIIKPFKVSYKIIAHDNFLLLLLTFALKWIDEDEDVVFYVPFNNI